MQLRSKPIREYRNYASELNGIFTCTCIELLANFLYTRRSLSFMSLLSFNPTAS